MFVPCKDMTVLKWQKVKDIDGLYNVNVYLVVLRAVDATLVPGELRAEHLPPPQVKVH